MNNGEVEMNDEAELFDDEYVQSSDSQENAIEWYSGNKRVTMTVSQRKFKNKIRELNSKYPDEVTIDVENSDGTLLVHMPLSYIHISRPREVSEEQKQIMKERAVTLIAEGKFGNRKNT